MIFGLCKESRKRVRADKTISAICPSCRTDLIAKIGQINIAHWAHRQSDCDHWHEPESEWHLEWKSRFHDSYVERTMGPHRADVVTELGVVIEFQKSPISPYEIFERENFYKNMVWVFDFTGIREDERFLIYDRGSYDTFRFKHPRKHIAFCESPVFLDIGHGFLFRVRKTYENFKTGWGNTVAIKDFLKDKAIFSGFEANVGAQKTFDLLSLAIKTEDHHLAES